MPRTKLPPSGVSLESGERPPALSAKEKASLIDEYVEVRARCLAWEPNVNPDAARLEELEAMLLAWCEKHPAAKPLVLKGTKYMVPITKRKNVRTVINVANVFKRIGEAAFLKVCTIGLGAIDKEIPKAERKQYVSEALTGNRTIQEPVRIG